MMIIHQFWEMAPEITIRALSCWHTAVPEGRSGRRVSALVPPPFSYRPENDHWNIEMERKKSGLVGQKKWSRNGGCSIATFCVFVFWYQSDWPSTAWEKNSGPQKMYKKLILRIFYISYHSSITTQQLFITKKHNSQKSQFKYCWLLHFLSTISKHNYLFHFFKIITTNHRLPLSFFKIITTNHILPLSFLENHNRQYIITSFIFTKS